jgi:CheY-like chemotaxis protein
MRILIVDDNDVNRRILEEQVSSWGCPALGCASGAAALKELANAQRNGDPFDLVIMDYHMPGMNGAQAVQRIRGDEKISSTPVIMLTSVDQANAGEIFDAIGVSAYLTKPVRSAALRRAAGQVLHKFESNDRETESIPVATLEPRATGAAVDVLVAEDNEVNRLVLSHILKGGGYRFEMATNGREAVEKFKALKPKLILMDVSMPELNGLEATREIRRLEADGPTHTPIIGVTAHAVKGDREECLSAGMDDYMPKPVSPARLTEKIEQHLMAAASDAA